MAAAFRSPGWYRAALSMAIGWIVAFVLVVGIRWLANWDVTLDWASITTVSLVTVPFAFLYGIGCLDYWLYWISGRPTKVDDHADHGAYKWQDYFHFNTDHKVIGIQYMVLTFFFFMVGGVLAMAFRAELLEPGMQFVDAQTFNGLFSAHAALMIFLFLVPVFAGIANYVLPLMLGAPDMAFPRLNAFSFWLLPIAGTMMCLSFIVPGGAFATGWTAYAPLSIHAPIGQTFFSIAAQFAGVSSILTAINFLVTIITMRAPGMTFWRMPMLGWANFATSLLITLSTPFIAGSQFMILFDRLLGMNFFDAAQGGDSVMYQHVFWFYSHPAVYIMVLPGFGIISEVISTHARKPIFGYRMMAFSLLAIIVLGFAVWAHHMFASPMQNWFRIPMMMLTMLIAVPTGVKIFSWVGTMWGGVIHMRTPMYWAMGFIAMFVLGGISGVMVAVVPFDIAITDTYFVVAHFHYVLFGGSVFTVFAGLYHWFPKITGRMYNETLGKWHFWLAFIGFNGTFGPQHLVGLEGMPRRVADYAEQFAAWNLFISLSSFLLGISTLIFVYNVVYSWRKGPLAGANPWHAHTLEWQVSSPPPVFNFPEIPTVVGHPYEFGVPGARHSIFKQPEPVLASVSAPDGEESTTTDGGA
jgi:cytochrome c oxidase subunit 1